MRAWVVSEPGVACNGQDGAGHGTVYSQPPSDIVPSLPAQIVAAQAWWIGQVPAGTGGSIGLELDKGGAYVTLTGFPVAQLPPGMTVAQSEQDTTTLMHSLTPLVPMVAITNYSQQASPLMVFNPPIPWNAGDKIFSGYSCAGGGGIQMGWAIYFKLP